MKLPLLFASVALTLLHAANAQTGVARPQASATHTGAAVPKGANGRITVPKLDRGVTLADFSGMKPSAWASANLAHTDAFVQNQPSDGKAPTEAHRGVDGPHRHHAVRGVCLL